MAAVEVTITFELPGFTPSAGRAFLKDVKRIEKVRTDTDRHLRESDTWAYQNVRIAGAKLVLRYNEIERYTVEGFGGFDYIVRDNTVDKRIGSKPIAFGPGTFEQATAVQEVLQKIEDQFTGLDEPPLVEDYDDYGDPDDLPF